MFVANLELFCNCSAICVSISAVVKRTIYSDVISLYINPIHNEDMSFFYSLVSHPATTSSADGISLG